MPTAKSFLQGFSNLDNVTASRVVEEIRGFKNSDILENEMGNRLLYSEAVPITTQELQLDLAILKQTLSLQPQKLYDSHLNKIIIPESLLEHFPNIFQLAVTLIESFNPLGIVSIYLQSERLGIKPLGTLIKPEGVFPESVVNLKIDGVEHIVKSGQLEIIPTLSNRVDLVFASSGVKLAGKNQFSAEIIGGSLGIIVNMKVS